MDPISLQIAFAAGSAIIAFIGAWIAFPLAQREERTSLPAQWQITTAVLAAAAGALLGWAFGGSWVLPAYLLLAVAGALLAAIDIRHHLLPNRLIGPFLAGAVALLLLATLATGSWTRLFLGLAGGVSLFAIYLVLALIKPGGIGMGDVKLAGVPDQVGGSWKTTPGIPLSFSNNWGVTNACYLRDHADHVPHHHRSPEP